MPHTNLNWQSGRFGNADAARVNLDDFIPISGVFSDPHSNPNSMEDRIIVGRKGSGKTLYLRKLAAEATERKLLTIGEQDGLETDLVRYMLLRIREYVNSVDRVGDLNAYVDHRKAVVSIWRAIWDKSIQVSTLSVYLSHKRKGTERSITTPEYRHLFPTLDDLEVYLVKKFSDLFPVPLMAITPQSAVRLFTSQFESPRQTHKFMHDPRWVELQSIVRSSINEVPPIMIYIDAIDSEFEDAPEAFLLCQLGLYRAVAQSGFSSAGAAGRTHIVAALRDIVFSAILRSEHAGRYYQNRHVKTLEWSPASIRRFSVEKMRSVLGRRTGSGTRSIEELFEYWIGFSTFTNGRNRQEDVFEYILRHGRMLPRDVVMFFNSIDDETRKRRAENKEFGEKSLRKVVAEVAHVIGSEMLDICMNELLSSSDLFGDFVASGLRRDPSGQDYRQFIEDKVRKFFLLAKNETLSTEELRSALIGSELVEPSQFEEGAHTYYRLDNLLWRHGLLAYRDLSGGSAKWKFNWKGAASTDLIPAKAERFGFHATIIDVHGLKTSGDGPVQ